MQVKVLQHSAVLVTFIKLTFVIKLFVLSIFEWLFYTDLTVGIKHGLLCINEGQDGGVVLVLTIH